MSTNTNSQYQAAAYLTRQEAGMLAENDPGLIDGILKLAARGLKSAGIREYAQAVAKGDSPPAFPELGGPKPVVILLHSFIRDPRQYSEVYGLASEDMLRLRDLVKVDEEGARSELAGLVAASTHSSINQRPVIVRLGQGKGGAGAPGQVLANASAVNKSLASEIKSDAALYGAYPFAAFETPFEEHQKFAVDLGQEFFSLAHSKQAAINVARIASVKGRFEPCVAQYVAYHNSAGMLVRGHDIDERKWSCRRGPRDPIVPSKRRLGATTVAPSSGGSGRKASGASEAGGTVA